jgi:hypothetical protein
MSNLAELNAHLFAALDRLDAASSSAEEIEAEAKRAAAIVEIADRITENAKVQIAAAKLFAEHREMILPMLPQIGKAADK